MKKNMIIAAAVLASAVACTKEIEEPSALDAKVQMCFAVSTEQTKTVLEGTKQTFWTGVEKLSIFDGESNNLFSAELSSPAATAQFIGKAKETSTYYALYPYNSAAKLSGTAISTELPAAQTATKDTFDPSAALLFGTADGTSVTLKNLTAMLKLTVPANVTSIEVDGNGTALAGSVNVNVESAELSGATASKVVLSGKGALEAGTYYIAVAPATVSGLSVKLIDSANSKYILKTASDSRELKANTIYDMGEFKASEWVAESTEPSGNDLVIFDNAFKSGFSSTSMTQETVDGENCLKWVFESAAAWQNYGVIDFENAIDFANFDADKAILKFKFKVQTDNGPEDQHTLFRVYFGAQGKAEAWVGAVGHNGAGLDWYQAVVNDTEWHELALPLKDYIAAMSGDNARGHLGFTPKDAPAAVGTTIYFKDVRISGYLEPELPALDGLVIYSNGFKTGYSSKSMTPETVDGQNCLKWVFESAAAWQNYGVIDFENAIDFANFDADKAILKFKFKVQTDNGPEDQHTLFRVYFGAQGKAEAWVGAVGHNGAGLDWYQAVVNDTEWHELALPLKDYIAAMSGDNARGHLGFTPKDAPAAVGTTIYFNDIRIEGNNGSSEPEQPIEDAQIIFNGAMQNSWQLGGTDGKYSIKAGAGKNGGNGIEWTIISIKDGAWGSNIAFELPSNTDISGYSKFCFDVCYVDGDFGTAWGFFQNRMYGSENSEMYYTYYAPEVGKWQSVEMPLADFTSQRGTDQWTKFKTFCFHPTSWVSATATVHIDNVRLVK